MSNFNYVIFVIAGVLCLATGASAEQSIGGQPGNEIGDFGEAPARSYVAPKKTIDLLQWAQHLRSDKPKFTKIDSPNVERLFSSAIHKQIKNDLPGAIADYLAAIKIDDKEPAVHWYLGTAYEAAGEATEAKQEFENEQAMKKKSLTINGCASGDFDNGFEDSTDSSPEMKIAWDVWHKRVAAAVYQSFSTLASAAFPRSRPLAAVAAYVVTRDGRIANARLTQPNMNPIFNALCLTAVNSLNGNQLLQFPQGSRRMTVDKASTFIGPQSNAAFGRYSDRGAIGDFGPYPYQQRGGTK